LAQLAVSADRIALFVAAKRITAKMAMMAMTTRTSTRVNPRLLIILPRFIRGSWVLLMDEANESTHPFSRLRSTRFCLFYPARQFVR
jgi:hypothetical protein